MVVMLVKKMVIFLVVSMDDGMVALWVNVLAATKDKVMEFWKEECSVVG